MSMQDPIADMLTKIRNAQQVALLEVLIPFSKIKAAIANVLKKEGFIVDWVIENSDKAAKKQLKLTLKYYKGRPVIDTIERVSRSSLRIYRPVKELPTVKNGLGVAIVSTSKGVMSDQEARKLHLGGEVLCYVS